MRSALRPILDSSGPMDFCETWPGSRPPSHRNRRDEHCLQDFLAEDTASSRTLSNPRS